MSRNKNASELGGAAGDSAAENRVQSGYSLGRDSGGEPLGDEPNRNRGRDHARTTVRNACLHCAVLEPPIDSAIPSDVRLRRLPQRRLGSAIIGVVHGRAAGLVQHPRRLRSARKRAFAGGGVVGGKSPHRVQDARKAWTLGQNSGVGVVVPASRFQRLRGLTPKYAESGSWVIPARSRLVISALGSNLALISWRGGTLLRLSSPPGKKGASRTPSANQPSAPLTPPHSSARSDHRAAPGPGRASRSRRSKGSGAAQHRRCTHRPHRRASPAPAWRSRRSGGWPGKR